MEIGPESGALGGKIIFEGTPKKYYENKYLNYIKNIKNINSSETIGLNPRL